MTDPECLSPDTTCTLRRPVRLGRGEDDADSMDVCVWQQGDERPCEREAGDDEARPSRTA